MKESIKTTIEPLLAACRHLGREESPILATPNDHSELKASIFNDGDIMHTFYMWNGHGIYETTDEIYDYTWGSDNTVMLLSIHPNNGDSDDMGYVGIQAMPSIEAAKSAALEYFNYHFVALVEPKTDSITVLHKADGFDADIDHIKWTEFCQHLIDYHININLIAACSDKTKPFDQIYF